MLARPEPARQVGVHGPVVGRRAMVDRIRPRTGLHADALPAPPQIPRMSQGEHDAHRAFGTGLWIGAGIGLVFLVVAGYLGWLT